MSLSLALARALACILGSAAPSFCAPQLHTILDQVDDAACVFPSLVGPAVQPTGSRPFPSSFGNHATEVGVVVKARRGRGQLGHRWGKGRHVRHGGGHTPPVVRWRGAGGGLCAHAPQDACLEDAHLFKKIPHRATASGEHQTLSVVVLYTRPRSNDHTRSRHLFLSLCRVLAPLSPREGGHTLGAGRSATGRWCVAVLSTTDTTLARCIGARVGGRTRLCRCRCIGCRVVDTIVEVGHGRARSFVCRLAHRFYFLLGWFAEFGKQVHVPHRGDGSKRSRLRGIPGMCVPQRLPSMAVALPPFS